jgi:hypothetical protein
MGLETNRLGLTWIWSESGQKWCHYSSTRSMLLNQAKKKDQAIWAMEQPILVLVIMARCRSCVIRPGRAIWAMDQL